MLIRDSRGRTLAKTIVYRVVAVALLAAITYSYTGSAGEATTITVLFNGVGTIAYYGLERLWEYVQWGRGKPGSAVSDGDRRPEGPAFAGTRAAPAPGSPETDSEVRQVT